MKALARVGSNGTESVVFLWLLVYEDDRGRIDVTPLESKTFADPSCSFPKQCCQDLMRSGQLVMHLVEFITRQDSRSVESIDFTIRCCRGADRTQSETVKSSSDGRGIDLYSDSNAINKADSILMLNRNQMTPSVFTNSD